ncbi:MAG: alpha/beta hydrolase [Actinomycetota bacterium]|nr:alpha/beta hydrolase [Actinomycetota bacterium]
MTAFTLTSDHLADLAATGAEQVVVETEGRPRLSLLDYGGEGVTVIMLPGITTPAMSFDFVSQGVRADYRVLALDIRGRGQSEAGTSWTLDDYAEDVAAVVEQLGLDRPILVGHSMGARIAAMAVARSPQAYRGAVIADPPLTGPGREPYPTPLSVFESQLSEAYAGTTADDVARWWPRWPRREQELRARWLASCDLDAVRGSYHSFDDVDLLPIWSQVSLPAVFMFGEESPVVTAAGLVECQQANEAATYIGVEAAGHMVFWDNYPSAMQLLTSALREIVATPST